jgi:hypothetical protein
LGANGNQLVFSALLAYGGIIKMMSRLRQAAAPLRMSGVFCHGDGQVNSGLGLGASKTVTHV